MELARDVHSATQAARNVLIDLGSQAAAAATACFGHVGAMNFVSNRTSRHWDVLFDRTTVDMSTDGRNLARGIPWGAGEALGPVRRAIPGQRVASEGYALFCSEFHYIVAKVTTRVSNRRPFRRLGHTVSSLEPHDAHDAMSRGSFRLDPRHFASVWDDRLPGGLRKE